MEGSGPYTDPTVAPSPQPQPAAAPQTPPAYAPQPASKKPMSAGAKWAIGLGTGFVLLVVGSCCWSFSMISKGSSTIATGDSIAVIRIEDTIQGGSTGSGSPEYVLDQLNKAVDDSNVKAILLRIDSPGGTVAASQEIMMGVRRAAKKKPVVTSVGDICASGAYMVASQSNEIVASPGSTVGSIGVIMELANVEELMNKLGVHFTTLTQGEYKDAGSAFRSLTATETAMLNDQMKLIHDQFIADVATGRHMDQDEVRKLATGWAWLGSEALDLGLVDSIGNYDDAVDRAAKLGGIKGEPNIVDYENVDPFATLATDLFGMIAPGKDIDAEALRRVSLPQ